MKIRVRRNQKGLDRYTIAKEMGVSYSFYCDVEDGKKTFNPKQLEDFLKVLQNSKELKLQKINILNDIKDFFERDEEGKSKADKKLIEYGIKKNDLINRLGISAATLYFLFSDFSKVGYETSHRVYDYLNGYTQDSKIDDDNSLHIDATSQIETEIPKLSVEECEIVDNSNDDSYYNDLELDSTPKNDETTRSTNDNMRIEMLEFENKMLRQKLDMISKIINM